MRKVSVCVPVCNGRKHLEACLRSIATQKGVDLEIVISDDLSTDGSFDYAKYLAKDYPSVSWVFQQNSPRAGMAGNWNLAVKASGGEYVKVVGHDDILKRSCLVLQADSLAARDDISVCSAECDILSHNGRRVFTRKRNFSGGLHLGNSIRDICLSSAANIIGEPITVMFKRDDFERVGGFDSSMQYYVDVDMWLRLLSGKQLAYIAEPLCGFRVHRGGASFSLQRQAFEEFLRMEAKFQDNKTFPLVTRIGRRLSAVKDSALRLVAYSLFG